MAGLNNVYAKPITRGHLGPVHGCNTMEFFHFLVFWSCAILLLTCELTDCSALPEELYTLGDLGGILPLIISYAGIIGGAIWNKYTFEVFS